MRSIRYSIFGFAMILVYSMVLPSIVEIPIGLFLGIAMLFTKNRLKIKVSFSLLVVTLFSASFFLLDSYTGYSVPRAIAYSLTIVLTVLFGMNWGTALDHDSYKKYVLFAIRVISYGLAFYILACILYTMLRGYEINAFNRSPYQIWNGLKGNGTHFATMSSLPIAVSCFDMLNKKGSKRFAAVAIFTLLFISNMMMVNRIIFVFVAAFLGFSVILTYKDSRFDKKAKVLLIASILLLLAYIVYQFNLFGIQTLLLRLPVFRRIQTLDALGYEDPRLERQQYVLRNFFKHTKGGGFFNAEVGEVHNVWLDVYDYAGMFPFLMIALFTISILSYGVKCFNASSNDTVAAYLLVVLFSCLLSFAEEPVMRSCEAYFVLFFFICGILHTYHKTYERRQAKKGNE